VNVQGDLPVLEPGALRRVVEPLDLLGTDMATLACPTEDEAEMVNPNVVKAVVAFTPDDQRLGRALYFTRATAPSDPAPSTTTSASTPSPVTRWSASPICRPARWSAGNGWSSCARWRTA
jgi:CMP-2-keto-3-deoxyoctulosonic acid synthetase